MECFLSHRTHKSLVERSNLAPAIYLLEYYDQKILAQTLHQVGERNGTSPDDLKERGTCYEDKSLAQSVQ